MSESYVVPIGGADTVQNKIALVLNRAGTSPDNPILRGLGMAVDVRTSPAVANFTAFVSQSDPREKDKGLGFTEIDTNQFRYRGRAGYDELGFDVDYSSAKRHFLTVDAQSADSVLATEREFWIKETPTVSFYLCGANLNWCDSAASAYPLDTFPGNPVILEFDPGSPPNGGEITPTAPNADAAQVQMGPDRVVEVGVYGSGTSLPVEVPINIMDSFRDEFNQKHYGGALYVSIFEEGLAEDQQGSLVTNVYQGDIKTTTSLSLLALQQDLEYRIVFRFRSELDDHHYVDYLCRFRVSTIDNLVANRTQDVPLSDLPTVDYDGTDYTWNGMAAFVASFGTVSADVVVDSTRISLPLDDVTPFAAAWQDQLALSYEGQIPILFEITTAFGSETLRVSYLVTRSGSGLPTDPLESIEPTSYSRFSATGSANYDPAIEFRLIEPSLDPGAGGVPGPVYLQVINLRIRPKFVTVWTYLGSIALDAETLRAGDLYDVTTLFDVNTVTGALDINVLNIVVQTENETRVQQVRTTVVRPFLRVRNPPVGAMAPTDDFVFPTFGPDYPDLTITWPALTDQGNGYVIANNDGAVAPVPASRFWVYGRKGIREIDAAVPGSVIGPASATPTILIANLLSEICFPDEEVFNVIYTIDHSLSGFGSDGVHYHVEAPAWGEYAVVPPSGWVPGDAEMILNGDLLIITQLPANFVSILLSGPLGSTLLTPDQVPLRTPIDLDALGVYAGVGILDITYSWQDPTLGFQTEGPFNLGSFTNFFNSPTVTFPNNPEAYVTSRLTESPVLLPKATIDRKNRTIKFDFTGLPNERYQRWQAINPLDQTAVDFNNTPMANIEYDITRCFRNDVSRLLDSKNSLVVTFLHEDGLHVSALYRASGQKEDPFMLNQLRGFV